MSWCVGHLVGLASPEIYDEKYKTWSFENLPIMPEQWKFSVTASTKKQFDVLKKLMSDDRVDELVCATDAGREGECIFRYVYNLVKCKKPFKRLWVSSMEDVAIREGFENLRSSNEYDNLYEAGLCRAKADWLVGMNGTRLFTVRYGATLNIGRVQTPTLAMIVERDNKVKNFIKEKYYTVDLNCGDFIEKCDSKIAKLSEKYLNQPYNGDLRVKIEKLTEKKDGLSEKLDTINSLDKPFAEQSSKVLEEVADTAQRAINVIENSGDISEKQLDRLTDDLCVSCVDTVNLNADLETAKQMINEMKSRKEKTNTLSKPEKPSVLGQINEIKAEQQKAEKPAPQEQKAKSSDLEM